MSTLVDVLPSVATVAASIAGALITGFGAAALKHKWDTEADETRWRRDGAARLRAQRLDAFGRYLTARPNLNAVQSLAEAPGDAADILSGIHMAGASLLILLPEETQRTIVENDLCTVENWVAAWSVPSSISDRTGAPSAKAILDLARTLMAEEERDGSRGGNGLSALSRWRLTGRERSPQ